LEILEKVGSVAYMLAFPASMRVHNVFHVSFLKKCVHDPNQIIDWNMIQVEHEGNFQVEPVRIMDQKVNLLRKTPIGLVKVQWTRYGPEMLHGSMNKTCGKNTHKVLIVLKKTECKTLLIPQEDKCKMTHNCKAGGM
jgi:hypothetical protein